MDWPGRWHSISLAGKVYEVRRRGRRLEVKDVDLELERTAAQMSGYLDPSFATLMLLASDVSHAPRLTPLQKIARRYDGVPSRPLALILADAPWLLAFPSLLEWVLKQGSQQAVISILERKDLTPALAQRFQDSSAVVVLVALASNPATPTSVLEHMPVNASVDIAAAVAGNPNATPEMLESALNWAAQIPQIAARIAFHPNASPQLLDQLALRVPQRVEVLAVIAANPKATAETLERLPSQLLTEVEAHVRSQGTPPAEVANRWGHRFAVEAPPGWPGDGALDHRFGLSVA